MGFITGVSLVFNGLALVLALGFLFILLLQNARSDVVQAFASVLFATILWSGSAFLVDFGVRYFSAIDQWGVALRDVGYVVSVVSLYSYVRVLTGVEPDRIWLLGIIAVSVVVIQHAFRIVIETHPSNLIEYEYTTTEVPRLLFFVIFGSVVFYRSWTYQATIGSRLSVVGVLCFLFSFGVTFPNTILSSAIVESGFKSLGIFLLGFGLIDHEIVSPFHAQEKYVSSIQRVTLAITSQIALNTVLDEFATQVIQWFEADGVAVFLNDKADKKRLELVTVQNLPRQLIGSGILYGDGVAGSAALTQESIFVEDYGSWQGVLDFPRAREFLGSVIGTPLMYANEVIGVLLVVSSLRSYRFRVHDLELLELLAAQAAVAITHSRLFDQIIEAREQLEVVLASTQSPVIAIDNNKQLIFANLAARTLLRFAGDNHLLDEDFLPEDWTIVIERLETDGRYVYEMKIHGRDFLCHISSLGDVRRIGWVIILNDVTELKELDRMKSEMVRMMSHDLKNPLMGAMAFVDLIQEDLEADKNDKGDVKANLTVIAKQLRRMDRIIRGVLDIERMRMGSDKFEELSVYEVIDDVFDEVETFALENRIQLQHVIEDDLPVFIGNSDQIKRALVNLVENAIKFSYPSGVVTVSVNSIKDRSELLFEIVDEGVGIPEELHDRIFDRFFRGEQPGIEHVSGSGLGLSLVKTIVEQHGGHIRVESGKGLGTRMKVELKSVDSRNGEMS